MRIVIVNWARIRQGASLGGGVNVYCQSLALALASRGHEVSWLCSGRAYRGGWVPWRPGRCEVRRLEDFNGVRVFEVLNSPVISPSIRQYSEPMLEVSAPELELRVEEFFRFARPEVVHFNNIEGFSIGCVDAAHRSGAAVVYSLHNYHTVCPQVYLMQADTRPCTDFAGGERCVGCIPTRTAGVERSLAVLKGRLTFGTPAHELGKAPTTAGLREVPSELRVLGRLFRSTAPPGVPFDAPPPVSTVRAQVQGSDPADAGACNADPLQEAWRPVDNAALPDPSESRGGLNAYGRRRASMVRMLSGCERVLAVSDFVHDKFVALGVDPRVVRTVPIGTRIGEIVAAAGGVPETVAAPAGPIRLLFMGYNNLYKGLGMLIDSIELLTPEWSRRFDLSVAALDGRTIRPRLEALRPRLASLTYQDGYRYDEIPHIARGRDLGVVPSVWWDNAPQTVFEFFACGVPVLGANLGGIPSFVKHGVNGLLFRGNDRFDLARRLVEVARDPEMLRTLRAGVRPPKSMDEHTPEMETLYRDAALIRRSRSPMQQR